MRKLIFGINLTADGCCDHTKTDPDDEVVQYFSDLIRNSGLLVYGRKTYELMVPFWPDLARSPSATTDVMNEFACVFDSVDKLVFSRSLKQVDDKRSRIAQADLPDEITRLKKELGGDMLLGGVSLPSQLIDLGLVDEYRIVIHPTIAGEGRRLFDTTVFQEKLRLKLFESRVFKSGAVALHYAKA